MLLSPETYAAARRRFLDCAICQLRPRYAQALAEYNRLYEHKTRILRDWPEKPSLLDTLDEFSLRMAQTGALLAVSGMEGDLSDKLFFFTGLDGVKFRRQVVPGDRLELHCDNIRMKLKLCKMDARAYVDGKLAAEAQITAAIGDRPKA